MRFVLEIEIDNAVFDRDAEIARILEEAAVLIMDVRSEPGEAIKLRDINGNTIGKMELKQ